jgi:anaerobic selenocysteine-containing dehydrogenase
MTPDIVPPDIVPSVCPHDCPSTCALEVERLDARRIGRIHGARDNPYTAGIVCAKVARYAERVHHPERLSHPLRRIAPKGVGGGRQAFEEISWEVALDLVAEAFAEASRRYGPEAVWPYYYAGTMGLLQRDGIGRLRHVLGYSRQHITICSTLAIAGWEAGAGVRRGLDPREMADSDLIVLWGTNAAATQVNVMTHVARAAKGRGAKLVVVDPYRTATAEAADLHLGPRPGTDGALACAVMHVLFEEGFADRDYLARYTDVPDELEAHLKSRTPDWAARITGLGAAEIVEFARLYGATKRSFLRLGFGFTRQRNGAANMHAVSCLPAVTGAWRQRGGGALYNNGALYRIDKTLIEGLDACDPKVRLLDMSRIGPILTGEKRDLGNGPPVTAMLIQNTNPAAVAPDSSKVRDGLLRDDLFLCVHEQFLTETAQMADIVLPATTFLEHNDLYLSGGHTQLQIARRAIEPHGKSRSNHAVICALAERLGADHPGFRMTEWEIIDATLRASGYMGADELAKRRWLDCAPDFETAHFLNGFGHADGKFHFAPDWAAAGPDYERMPELPDHMPAIEEADAEHPFRLVTAPARNFLNSSFTETPTSRKREGRPTALIHPDDCRDLGLAKDERVRIGNRRGSVVVRARPFDGLQRKVVVVEGVWPNAAFEEGRGINTLTGADPGPPNGGAVFHDSAVWLRSA